MIDVTSSSVEALFTLSSAVITVYHWPLSVRTACHKVYHAMKRSLSVMTYEHIAYDVIVRIPVSAVNEPFFSYTNVPYVIVVNYKYYVLGLPELYDWSLHFELVIFTQFISYNLYRFIRKNICKPM